jgi:hypothetical protein
MAKKEKVTLQELIIQTPELKSSLLKFENVKLQLDKAAETCLQIKVTDSDSLSVAENNMGKMNDLVKVIEKTRKDEKQPYLEKGQAIDAAAAYVSELSESALKHLKDEKIAYIRKVEAENKRKQDIQDSINKTKEWASNKLTLVNGADVCDYCIGRLLDVLNRKEFYQEFFPQIQEVVSDYTRLFNLKKQEFAAESPDELDAIKEVQAEIKQNIESADIPKVEVEIISKVRRPWCFEIVDINLVPKEFLMVDESKVKEYLKANSESLEDGKVVNGIKYYKDLKVTV